MRVALAVDRLPAGLVDRLPAELADRLLADLADGGDDPARFVCPFCGRTYAGPRRCCAGCDGVPVVRADDRQVYAAIVGPCGPAYDPE